MNSLYTLAFLLVSALGIARPVAASETDHADTSFGSGTQSPAYWRLIGSPYTVHYDSDPEHKYVYLVGLERQRDDGRVLGAAWFSNSFGQASGYVYLGKKITGFSRSDQLFFQWTAGVIYGYTEPYEDKVPLNHNGFSPGVTAGLGWQFNRKLSGQAIALGTAAVMFQLAFDFH